MEDLGAQVEKEGIAAVRKQLQRWGTAGIIELVSKESEVSAAILDFVTISHLLGFVSLTIRLPCCIGSINHAVANCRRHSHI